MLVMPYSKTREPKISNEQSIRSKILELQDTNLNYEEIAKACGCSKEKLTLIMNRMGVSRPKRHACPTIPESRILAMLDEYVRLPEKSIYQIAEDFEISFATLCKYVRVRGVPRRKKYKMVGNTKAKGAPKGRKYQHPTWMVWECRTYGE
jgi:hypothetical protein